MILQETIIAPLVRLLLNYVPSSRRNGRSTEYRVLVMTIPANCGLMKLSGRFNASQPWPLDAARKRKDEAFARGEIAATVTLPSCQCAQGSDKDNQ